MGVFARYDLKRYCIPEKACNFIFSTKTPSKNKTFAKKQQIKRQASFFHCDIMLKLSEFGQVSCVIPYYIVINDFPYQGKFTCQSSEKLVQNEKDYSLTLKF